MNSYTDNVDPNEPIRSQPLPEDPRLSWKLAEPSKEQFTIKIRQQTTD